MLGRLGGVVVCIVGPPSVILGTIAERLFHYSALLGHSKITAPHDEQIEGDSHQHFSALLSSCYFPWYDFRPP
jgi:hypothetical protein